jgi:hypothetical protein
MRPGTRATRLAALLAVWLLPVSAVASGGAFVSSPAGTRARPDELIPLSWTLDRAEMDRRDEMELVLSLDDGVSFPVRVVARLDAADGGTRWRVPSLPTEHARLALRAGRDGEGDTEELVAVSDSFAIAASRFDAPEELFAVAEEWRTRDALEGAPTRSAADGVASEQDAPEVAPADRERSEPETSPVAEMAPASTDCGSRVAAEPSEPAVQEPPSPPRAPLPLRL